MMLRELVSVYWSRPVAILKQEQNGIIITDSRNNHQNYHYCSSDKSFHKISSIEKCVLFKIEQSVSMQKEYDSTKPRAQARKIVFYSWLESLDCSL